MSPEIVGHFPVDEDPSRQEPCVLCREPTSTRASAPGIGTDVELPLHVLCAAWLVRAYGKLRLSTNERLMLSGAVTRAVAYLEAGETGA